MNEVAFPIVSLLVIVIAMGLVALLAGGLAKHNAAAGEQKRSQAWKIAVGAAAVLLVGFCFFVLVGVVGVSHDRQVIDEYRAATPAPAQVSRAMPGAGVWSNSTSVNTDSTEMRGESDGTHHIHFHQADAHGAAEVKMAWAPIALVTLVVGGIVLVAASRRGINAILAGLGIVGAMILLYALRSMPVQPARMPTLVPPVAERVTTPVPATRAVESVTTTTAESSADGHGEAHDSEHDAATTDKAGEKTKPAAEKTTAEKETTPAAPPPAWVGSDPKMENGVYYATVVSGPYATKWECEDRLRGPLQDAVRRYADRHMRPAARYYAWSSYSWARGNVLDDQIIEDSYYEPIQASFGPMLKLHVLLKIDQSDVAFFEEVARRAQTDEAVSVASASAACVLGALVLVYGGLRFVGRKKRASPETSPSLNLQPPASSL